jgi:hypothetical protein
MLVVRAAGLGAQMYDAVNTVASIATAIGVLAAVAGLRASRRQRMRSFEQTYVDRYWTVMASLSLGASKGEVSGITDEDRRTIISYFRLCEDELQLRTLGWVGNSTWKIWGPGIRLQLRQQPFKAVWDEIKPSGEQPNGSSPDETPTNRPTNPLAFSYITNYISDRDSRDPIKIGPFRQWSRCLTGSAGG